MYQRRDQWHFIVFDFVLFIFVLLCFLDTAARISLERRDASFGTYPVSIRVTDTHGLSQISTVKVKLCDCVVENECTLRSDARTGNAATRLGKWAILAILLGIALLFCKSYHICH